jgi:hypothetical protein
VFLHRLCDIYLQLSLGDLEKLLLGDKVSRLSLEGPVT